MSYGTSDDHRSQEESALPLEIIITQNAKHTSHGTQQRSLHQQCQSHCQTYYTTVCEILNAARVELQHPAIKYYVLTQGIQYTLDSHFLESHILPMHKAAGKVCWNV